MSSILPAFWPAALVAMAALNVSAQPAPAAPKPPAVAASTAAAPKPGGPLPAAPVAANAATIEPASGPFGYRSVFQGYQPFTEEKVRPWNDSNETVRAGGGWRAYAREAADPSKDGAPPTPAPAASAAHGGHAKP